MDASTSRMSLEQAVGATVASVESVQLTERQTKERAQLLKQEAAQEIALALQRRQAKWTYLDKETIDNQSPSRKDGIDAVKESRWRREYLHLIQRAGMALKV